MSWDPGNFMFVRVSLVFVWHCPVSMILFTVSAVVVLSGVSILYGGGVDCVQYTL